MEMKTVATFYYAAKDKNGNPTSNKNFNKKAKKCIPAYSFIFCRNFFGKRYE